MFVKALAPLALLANGALALNQLKVVGNQFVDSVTNDRFNIIGVAYQPGGSAGFNPQTGADPLSDGQTCLRDAILMQQLGVNTIRVYNLDPTVSHDECAGIFNAAGIYMIIDVNSPLAGQSINQDDPSSTYDSSYLQHIFQVVEAFKEYSNLIGFFSGNEIVNDLTTGSVDPPYIRAVTRDLKNYIAKHSDRAIPVGYSAADVRTILFDTWNYLQCDISSGNGENSNIDFFGLNSYSWCGPTGSYETSGYNTMVSTMANSSVPIFFSEYGCNKVLPRTFPEVPTIYGEEMLATMSGGLVYEWTQETNNYGLVNLNDNNTVSALSDYGYLQQQLQKLNIKQIMQSSANTTTRTPPTCAADLIVESGFSNNFNIPAIPSGGQSLIDNGVTGANSSGSYKVSNTAMPCTAYGSNGVEMQGLSLKVVSTSNTPNATENSSSSSSSSAAIPFSADMHLSQGVAAAGLLSLLFL